MANVGILTMNLRENMGGILQAYALYKEVEQLGHTPILFRLSRDESPLKRMLRKVMERNPFAGIYDHNHIHQRFLNCQPMCDFVDRAFSRKTKIVSSEKDFITTGNALDAIIVGSDQVWRYAYVGNKIEKYFLKGIDNSTKKIAYAASFGISEWEGHNDAQNKELEDLLQQFDYVSVREQSGIAILENTFHYTKGSVCLDPTLLHPASFYDELIETYSKSNETPLPRSKYILAYVLDLSSEKMRSIEGYAQKQGMEVVFASIPTHKQSLSPASWLAHMRSADMVITDSFHGTVFSSIYHRPCICLGNSKRGAERFWNLFKILQITPIETNDMGENGILLRPPYFLQTEVFDQSLYFLQVGVYTL